MKNLSLQEIDQVSGGRGLTPSVQKLAVGTEIGAALGALAYFCGKAPMIYGPLIGAGIGLGVVVVNHLADYVDHNLLNQQ